MTTVCFLPPGPSACREHQRWGEGVTVQACWLCGRGPGGQGQGQRWAASGKYLSSPPALSFCRVELGPQVRPFFLPPTSSSFFGGPLRPHVPLPPPLLPLLLPPPSTGVTGSREAAGSRGLGQSLPTVLPASLSDPPSTSKSKGPWILTPSMILPLLVSTYLHPPPWPLLVPLAGTYFLRILALLSPSHPAGPCSNPSSLHGPS